MQTWAHSLNGELSQKIPNGDYKNGDIIDCKLIHDYTPGKTRVYKKARVEIFKSMSIYGSKPV